jgi:serine protease Do
MTQSTIDTPQSSFPLPDAFSSALVSLVERVQPSIVQVIVNRRGGGTGVIWQEDGRIITNNHVVPSDNLKVQVLLSDGRKFDAKVLHRNPRLDLAILQVNGENLQALPLGDSAKLRIGEWVFAIGHPFGERWVVTAGIMSSKSTIKFEDGRTTEYIKSDVRLAPGNSGGPLLNADGEVVGINAMIFGGDLSVSIPSNVLSNWIASLSSPAANSGITLGIEILTVELPLNVRQTLTSQQETGVLITGIREARQKANHTDILLGDVLLSVAGTLVKDTSALRYVLAQSEKREIIPVSLLRGGKVITVNVATNLAE